MHLTLQIYLVKRLGFGVMEVIMKKSALLGAAFGLSAIVASCGLIPPVKFANPVGLQGQTMTANLANNPATGNLGLQNAGTGSATVSATFADTTQSIPFTPSSFTITLNLTNNVTISPNCAPAAAATNGVSVSLTNFSFTLSDGSGQSVRTLTKTIAGPVTFTISSTGVVSGLNPAALAFALGADLTSALNIIQTAPTPNTVSASVNVATTPALAGCSLTFTFAAGEGEVKL
jgi:hypothetical protein